jgi:hypothetical protein
MFLSLNGTVVEKIFGIQKKYKSTKTKILLNQEEQDPNKILILAKTRCSFTIMTHQSKWCHHVSPPNF